MHRPSPVALALGVVLCVAPALGAQIVLKNGDRVSGQIEHADAKTVTVTTDAAGELGSRGVASRRSPPVLRSTS